jgi:hypothetical protein
MRYAMKYFNNMCYGRETGIVSILVGIAFLLINTGTIYYNETFYPKLLFVGIVIIFFGISLVIFPGGDFKKADVPVDAKHPRKKGNKRRIPDFVPAEEIIYELNDAEKGCTCCGKARPVIAELNQARSCIRWSSQQKITILMFIIT